MQDFGTPVKGVRPPKGSRPTGGELLPWSKPCTLNLEQRGNILKLSTIPQPCAQRRNDSWFSSSRPGLLPHLCEEQNWVNKKRIGEQGTEGVEKEAGHLCLVWGKNTEVSTSY